MDKELMACLLSEENLAKIILSPVVVKDEPNAYIVKFKVGVQQFMLDGYQTKEESEWMGKMLIKAFETVAKAQLQSSKLKAYIDRLVQEVVKAERERVVSRLLTMVLSLEQNDNEWKPENAEVVRPT